jgi:hypothetical protein
MEVTTDLQMIDEAIQKRRRVLKQMTEDVRWLMAQPAESVGWTSTQRDLLELVQVAWTQKTLTDEQGRLLTRKVICDKTFGAVGYPVPVNVAGIIRRMMGRRKAYLTLVHRYEYIDDERDMFYTLIDKKDHDKKRKNAIDRTFHPL